MAEEIAEPDDIGDDVPIALLDRAVDTFVMAETIDVVVLEGMIDALRLTFLLADGADVTREDTLLVAEADVATDTVVLAEEGVPPIVPL